MLPLRLPFVLLLLAGCAPVVRPGGGVPQPPELRAEAFVSADGAVHPLRVWPAEGAPRAVVLALHGFNDYANAFDWPADWFRRRGVTFYAYDQRGFGGTATRGMWAGETALADDLAEATGLLRARYPTTPLFILGESMGGAVAIVAAARHNLPVDGVILASPAVWGGKWMNPLYRLTLWTGAHVMPWREVTGRGLKVRATDNTPILRGMGRDPRIVKATRLDAIYGLVQLMDSAVVRAPDVRLPVLLLYGAKDQVIPPRAAGRAAASMRASLTVRRYPVGYHMFLRDVHAQGYYRDMLGWMAAPRTQLAETRSYSETK